MPQQGSPGGGARRTIPYGTEGVVGHMRPIIFPPEGVLHPRTAQVSCQAGMMGEVQYLRPKPFQYHPLQGPMEGGLADEEPALVNVEV